MCKAPLSDKITTDNGGFYLWHRNGRKSTLRKLIDERGIKDLAGVQRSSEGTHFRLDSREIMDAELEEDLGYSKYDYKNKQTENSRNRPLQEDGD